MLVLAARIPLIDRTSGHDRAIAVHRALGKPALYLRYPSRAHLVFAAMVEASLLPDLPGLPDMGSLRDDLTLTVQMLAESLSASPRVFMAEQFAACILDGDFAREVTERVHDPALDAISAIWTRALDRGEVNPEVDGRARLIDLASAVVMRVHYFHLEVTDDDVHAMVDHFISGVTGPTSD